MSRVCRWHAAGVPSAARNASRSDVNTHNTCDNEQKFQQEQRSGGEGGRWQAKLAAPEKSFQIASNIPHLGQLVDQERDLGLEGELPLVHGLLAGGAQVQAVRAHTNNEDP